MQSPCYLPSLELSAVCILTADSGQLTQQTEPSGQLKSSSQSTLSQDRAAEGGVGKGIST